eukprot:CAMPEP_0118804018 /NCGR_PEP_ID=MMETSP1161-20130426/20613_1 /TAXON_ID=249345 /ORGANISM="Picochlorum oklahomensis, Strain CCMP2329" /LENGTH=73 /DNA_ID=CAMNT_0006732663 /DNA_START=47 /DNA_END=268 /DNA_ORIENTATION=-
MGFLAGAVTGLAVQLYSNGIRRLPLMKNPWEHLIAVGIGGAIGVKYTEWENNQREDLENTLKSLNKSTGLIGK